MRIRRLLPLALVAATLPGCYVVHSVVPLDTSGMDHPKRWLDEAYRDQCERTAARVTGFPEALRDHFLECERNLMYAPGEPYVVLYR